MKVLIISHTPISKQNNMGLSFLSLFSSFKKEELCQLYIYPSYPDGQYCNSFYRVTDKDLLKSFIPGSKVESKNIHSNQKLYEFQEDEGFYRNVKNKTPIRRIARDLLWFAGNWHNKNMKEWLREEQPTCIFLAPGAACFIYSIALKISRNLKIPIFTYICDEYYFVNPEQSLLGKIRLFFLKHKIESVMKETKCIIAISNEIKELYTKKFLVPATVIMTGSRYKPIERVAIQESPQNLSYLGNIRLNRNVSLAEIGRALDVINDENGTSYVLNIYTGEKDKQFLNAFNNIRSIELHGFVSGEDFENAVNAADILIHTEAFDDKSIDRVKHSISTKIADSLTLGKPILAYGPSCISSIKHLSINKSAVTIDDKSKLKEKLMSVLNEQDVREGCVANATETAKLFHDTEENSKKLYKTLVS